MDTIGIHDQEVLKNVSLLLGPDYSFVDQKITQGQSILYRPDGNPTQSAMRVMLYSRQDTSLTFSRDGSDTFTTNSGQSVR